MKDKKNYLKLACIIELVYIIFLIIYDIINYNKISNVYFEISLIIIDIIMLIILYKEVKKPAIEINKKKILVISTWMLFEPILPGILGIIYLSSYNKNKTLLPYVKQQSENKLTYIKSIILLLLFIFMILVFPNLNLYKKIPFYLNYIFIFIIIIIFNHKEIIDNFIVFKSNFKTYVKFILKRYLYMLLTLIMFTIPIVIFAKNNISPNQVIINSMFKKAPLIMLLLSTLYAPFVEECVLRLNLSKLFNNKNLFIITSGLLFGVLHMIGKITNITDILYIFQYCALGICLSKAYSDSNNIFVSISMHFIQNFLAAVLTIIVL